MSSDECHLEGWERSTGRDQRLSDEQQEHQRRQNTERMVRYRQHLSDEQQEHQRRQNAQRMTRNRQRLSDERQEGERHPNSEQTLRHSHQRSEERSAIDHTVEILSGQFEVIPFSIGLRVSCTHCKARLWGHEKKWTSICCAKGNVIIRKWEQRGM